MYNCLKEGWIPLQDLEKNHELTRWQAIKLANKISDEYKCKIGTVIFVSEEKALEII